MRNREMSKRSTEEMVAEAEGDVYRSTRRRAFRGEWSCLV